MRAIVLAASVLALGWLGSGAAAAQEANGSNFSKEKIPILRSGRIVRPANPEDAIYSTIKATLGRGINTFNGEMVGDCVAGDFEPPRAGGLDIKFDMKLIKSQEDYEKATSLDVSASGGYGAFKASASVHADNSVKISNLSDYLLIRVSAGGPNIILQNVELSNFAFNNKASREKFFTVCGNRYVSAVRLGGQFIVLYEFQANSETERSSLQANLNVAVGSNSAETAFKTAMDDARSKSTVKVKISQLGTGQALPAMSVDQLVDYAREFPLTLTPENMRPIEWQTARYKTTIDSDLFSYEESASVHDIRESIASATATLADIDALKERYDLWRLPRMYDFDTIARPVSERLYRLDAALQACADEPWRACDFSPDTLEFTRPALPPLPIRIAYTALHGDRQQIGYAGVNETRYLLLRGTFRYAEGENYADAATHTEVTIKFPQGDTGLLRDEQVRGFDGPGRIWIVRGPTLSPEQQQNIESLRYSVNTRIFARLLDSDYSDNKDKDLEAILF